MAQVGLELSVRRRWWFGSARRLAIGLILMRLVSVDRAARWLAEHAVKIRVG